MAASLPQLGMPTRASHAARACHGRGGGLHSPAGAPRSYGRRKAGDLGGKQYLRRQVGQGALAASLLWLAGGAAAGEWWAPGDGRPLPAEASYANAAGALGILNTAGADRDARPSVLRAARRERPRLRDLPSARRRDGAVGRHRPRALGSDRGQDPLFAAHRRPQLPASARRRPRRAFAAADARPVPRRVAVAAARRERRAAARRVHARGRARPDGLQHASRARPRIGAADGVRLPAPAARREHEVSDAQSNFGVGPFIAKSGLPAVRDPDTGLPTSMNMMADARVTTLKAQAADAARTHLGCTSGLPAAALERIVAFEQQIYAAQAHDARGRRARRRAPPGFGPRNLAAAPAGVLGNNTTRYVFPLGDAWRERRGNGDGRATREGARRDRARPRRVHVPHVLHPRLDALEQRRPRQSRQAHVLDVPRHAHDRHGRRERLDGHRHDESAVGARGAAEPVDDARRRSCRCSRSRATPTSRRIRFSAASSTRRTRAARSISGKCNDVGAIVMQQFRGLAARAPYFSNGSAATLRELVDFYDRRYSIGYSEQEKRDLVAFLAAL